MVVEEKWRVSAARAFPDWAAAKPKGSNRTTEITFLKLLILGVFLGFALIQYLLRN
jgi:hypothetical protein